MSVVGIIGVDPGVTTGLAWGRFNPALRDRAGLWKALAHGRSVQCGQIGGGGAELVESGLQVCLAVGDILADWNLDGMIVGDMYVIVEDFQVRMGERLVGGTARDKLAPVYITGMLTGALVARGLGGRIVLVGASTHKSKANDERLKRWAAMTGGRAGWVKGKGHARDAFRLLATGFDGVV